MASDLANEHRNLALDALEELPDIDCEFANTCRAALRDHEQSGGQEEVILCIVFACGCCYYYHIV